MDPTERDHPRTHRALIAVELLLTTTISVGTVATVPAAAATLAFPNTVVPAPVSAVASGATFTLPPAATISSDVADVGNYLAGVLRSSTGYAIPVSDGSGGSGTIELQLSGAPASVGTQGYQLTITGTGGARQANPAAGPFPGGPTPLQLLPPAAAGRTA